MILALLLLLLRLMPPTATADANATATATKPEQCGSAIAAVLAVYVVQQVHRLYGKRAAGLGHANAAQRLAAVGMRVAGEGVGRGADDRLRHAE